MYRHSYLLYVFYLYKGKIGNKLLYKLKLVVTIIDDLPVKIREEPSIAFIWSSRTGTLQSCWNSVDHILRGKRHWHSQRADDKAKGTWYQGSLAELPLRELWAQSGRTERMNWCNERNQIKAFISSNITSLMYFKAKLRRSCYHILCYWNWFYQPAWKLLGYY